MAVPFYYSCYTITTVTVTTVTVTAVTVTTIYFQFTAILSATSRKIRSQLRIIEGYYGIVLQGGYRITLLTSNTSGCNIDGYRITLLTSTTSGYSIYAISVAS